MKIRPLLTATAACAALTIPAANAFTVLGTGTGALLGSDLTDPENDGSDTPEPTGNGLFNWVSISASGSAFFDADNTPTSMRQGSFDLFDNKVNNGEGKFCCDGATWNVTVQFAQPYTLTHFTAASSGDSVGRDPDVWQIQGSNDGSSWTNIFSFDDNDTNANNTRNYQGNSPWTARNQVIRWDGAGADFATPAAYSHFRLNVDSAGGWVGAGGQLALAELELFGTAASVTPLQITEIDYDSVGDTFRFTWDSEPGKEYTLRWSPDLINWDADVDDGIPSQGDSTTYPLPEDPAEPNPGTTVEDGRPHKIFFRVEENPPLPNP